MYQSHKKLIIVSGVGVAAVTTAVMLARSYQKATPPAAEQPLITEVHSMTLPLTFEELMRETDTVIIGTVTSLKAAKVPSQVRPGREDIVSDATVQVEEYLLPTTGSQSSVITVRVLGGKIGHEELIVSASNTLAVGQQLLLFLRKSTPDLFVLSTDAHSQYVITNGTVGVSDQEKQVLKNIIGKETSSLDVVKEKVKTGK
jgi:hypothetical protein